MARYEVTAWYAFVHESIKGMTAKEAALKAGLTATSLSRWRSGHGAEPKAVVQFARAHGLDVLQALVAAELITEEEAGNKVVQVAPDMGSIRISELLAEVQRRLSLLEEGLGIADSAGVRGNGAIGSQGAASGQPDPDESSQGLRAGRDRTGETRLGDEVLDTAGDVAALPLGGPGTLVSRVDPPTHEEIVNDLMKHKPGRWGQNHIAALLGLTSTSWSKVLNGQIYPARLQTMQKIEVVFGWPVSEQVQLIPMYWEWPDQASAGKPAGEPTDLRYAIKLGRIVAEWADANPRTVPAHEITLHADLKPLNGHEGPRSRKKKVEEEEPPVEEPEEPQAPSRPLNLTLGKNPLLKR